MFEAKLKKAAVLKKLIDGVKDVIADAPIDCNEHGMTLQVISSSLCLKISFSRWTLLMWP